MLIELLPFFDLRYTENHGISLGLFQATSDTDALGAGGPDLADRHRRRLLDHARGEAAATRSRSAWCFGGALGNILDRVRHGYVVDFADLHFGSFRPFFIFNVADAAISIGVAILLLRAFLVKEQPKENAEHA